MAEKRLYNAAAMGHERTLQELLQVDPLVLDRVSYTSKTPLHIATIKGHLPFVQEILNHNPHLAEELDSQQSSALHMASVKGDVEIVKILLSAAPDMCMSRDSQGRNPLHLAAIKGHVQVLEELFRVAPFAAQEKVDGGLNLLHLCAKYSQIEALKTLVPQMNELLISKDDDGDTILHMAVRYKQIEVINFLLTKDALEVNALNRNGMTALDVLSESRRAATYSEIKKSLKSAGGVGNLKNSLLKQHGEWLEKKKSALMVVASLLATIAFQAGVNPPGGVWQEDEAPAPSPAGNHSAGNSIIAQKIPSSFRLVYIYNTISLITSLTIILLLVSGLPIRRRFFMWILMAIIWIAIIATALTYMVSIFLLTYNDAFEAYSSWIDGVLFVWMGITGLLFICHTIRLFVKLVRWIVKLVSKLKKTFMRRSWDSTVPVNNTIHLTKKSGNFIVKLVKKPMNLFTRRITAAAGSTVPANNVNV